MMQKTSRLFYHGTSIEVHVGDRVKIQRWLRPPINGTVCYLPDISPYNKNIDEETLRAWAIKLDNGAILIKGYDPGNQYGQPNRSIVFLQRTEALSLDPHEEIH